jgi:hypothetical protein
MGTVTEAKSGLETAAHLTGDRGFESISLQRRVRCEPDFVRSLLLQAQKMEAMGAYRRGARRARRPAVHIGQKTPCGSGRIGKSGAVIASKPLVTAATRPRSKSRRDAHDRSDLYIRQPIEPPSRNPARSSGTTP